MSAPRVVAGNWKMHQGPRRTRDFFKGFRVPASLPGPAELQLLIFPPAVSLLAAAECPERDPRVALGVQNIHFEAQGAFTGETSAPLAAEAGATHALIGHSERRHVFGETDAEVARKVEAALKHGLLPVICLGETLAQRRAGAVDEVILGQLEAVLPGLGDDGIRFMIAYEPVWAIGTGETATPEDARAAHAVLRDRLAAKLGQARASQAPILYGGSVKPENAGELLAAPGVDGLLVGGASLEPASFQRIVEAAVDAAR
jgi:triosephosphate isomerase